MLSPPQAARPRTAATIGTITSIQPARLLENFPPIVWSAAESTWLIALTDRRDLILLQLPVRHLERPNSDHAVREGHAIRSTGHSTAKRLTRLHESSRRSKCREARLKIF